MCVCVCVCVCVGGRCPGVEVDGDQLSDGMKINRFGRNRFGSLLGDFELHPEDKRIKCKEGFIFSFTKIVF